MADLGIIFVAVQVSKIKKQVRILDDYIRVNEKPNNKEQVDCKIRTVAIEMAVRVHTVELIEGITAD